MLKKYGFCTGTLLVGEIEMTYTAGHKNQSAPKSLPFREKVFRLPGMKKIIPTHLLVGFRNSNPNSWMKGFLKDSAGPPGGLCV